MPLRNLSIIGATGAVGSEVLSILEQYSPLKYSIRLFASERSKGKAIVFNGNPLEIEATLPSVVAQCDAAILSAGSSTSKLLVPTLLERGCLVIDNSSAYRMSDTAALVVPEVNGYRISDRQKLYSVPNCTAILLTMVLKPIHSRWPIRRVIVSTYQSASGGGAKLMEELKSQTADALSGKEVGPSATGEPYAFNLFSHNTPLNDEGWNEEELKVVAETKKLLDAPDLLVNATCVRVPVLRAHSESVTIEFASVRPSEEELRSSLKEAPGIIVADDRANNKFPTPLKASGKDEVWVGRIRHDPTHPLGTSLFLCGDQLRKGAALTAVQILEAYNQLSG